MVVDVVDDVLVVVGGTHSQVMTAAFGWQRNPGLHVPPQTGKAPQRGSVVLVVVMIVTDVLVVVPLHEAMQAAGAPSFDTLNVVASFGFGVAVAVPAQYSSPVPSVKFVA